ncbi:glutathione peroxidase [Aestuariirhabdus litorea]|uniref:Glutathione peroxidase n=1 Tax=Aestuariirhabdus litorea TaxID=2528527 RepID=A0A3P3VUV7_9GAMM|nr:glutathione peroxidase [Aestuariirhabdus litorea]RRJ84533.1 glutathione peroxidase [Aestuariirhabdus litorea]RWW97758.1 redoxin domain-containing protein [Endozoicomonadaceae bacterium GTF-13]
MFEDRQGQPVPQVNFTLRENNEWREVTSDQLFKGKSVILFALPGAFTPTCSSTHLPRYNELADTFAANGIDEIICLSVNDTFVMNEWKAAQHAEKIRFIPDGNGDFSEGMGMLVNKAELGFGKRSWRYSMLVRDGIIEKMFIEPNQPGDPFKVSDADTMLNYINPNANTPEFATLFTKPGCPHCARAKALLEDKGYPFEVIELGAQITTRSLRAATGAGTVPQVFIGGKLIGSADALEAHFA